jgi:hypothetical protein
MKRQSYVPLSTRAGRLQAAPAQIIKKILRGFGTFFVILKQKAIMLLQSAKIAILFVFTVIRKGNFL